MILLKLLFGFILFFFFLLLVGTFVFFLLLSPLKKKAWRVGRKTQEPPRYGESTDQKGRVIEAEYRILHDKEK